MPFTRILTLMTLLLLSAGAQETPPVENNPEPPPLTALDRKREALSRILLRKESIDKEIATIRKEISTGNLPKTEFEQTEAFKKNRQSPNRNRRPRHRVLKSFLGT